MAAMPLGVHCIHSKRDVHGSCPMKYEVELSQMFWVPNALPSVYGSLLPAIQVGKTVTFFSNFTINRAFANRYTCTRAVSMDASPRGTLRHLNVATRNTRKSPGDNLVSNASVDERESCHFQRYIVRRDGVLSERAGSSFL
eukprot:scaffold8790_cov187-Amphora_coffeaeformis.AAC.4